MAKDPRHENTPQEKEAFKAILGEPNPRLEEKDFLEKYFAIIANIDGAGKYIGNWLEEVDRTMCQEVDIYADGKLLYTLPPLLFTYPSESHYDRSRDLSVIAADVESTKKISPIAAERYLDKVLETHLESVLTSEKCVSIKHDFMRRWDEIWIRYGLPPRFSKELGEKAVELPSEPKPEAPTQPAFDDYDEI